MDRVSDEQLIRALRCSSSPKLDDSGCKACPYGVIEMWREEEIQSCDCDRIGMDAAARLEELTVKHENSCRKAAAEEEKLVRQALDSAPAHLEES